MRLGRPDPYAGSAPVTVAGRAADWARGRSWIVRLPLLVWLGYVFWRHLGDPFYVSLFHGLNLGIHELGHLLFAPLGEAPGVAGGTILQLLIPLVGAWMFARQHDYFAIAVAACWLGTNLFEIATYAGDARARALPLASLGAGEPIHDWTYMLEGLDLLLWDETIARGFRAAGALAMIGGLGGGAWLLWKMRRPAPGAATVRR